MKNKLLLAIFSIILGGVGTIIFAENLFLYLAILLTIVVLGYIININNQERRENLNIIKDEHRLYFYLTDDLLFSVDLPKNKNVTKVLKKSIKDEMTTLKDITRKICFINFKDDNLLNELNSKLKNSQQQVIR